MASKAKAPVPMITTFCRASHTCVCTHHARLASSKHNSLAGTSNACLASQVSVAHCAVHSIHPASIGHDTLELINILHAAFGSRVLYNKQGGPDAPFGGLPAVRSKQSFLPAVPRCRQ